MPVHGIPSITGIPSYLYNPGNTCFTGTNGIEIVFTVNPSSDGTFFSAQDTIAGTPELIDWACLKNLSLVESGDQIKHFINLFLKFNHSTYIAAFIHLLNDYVWFRGEIRV